MYLTNTFLATDFQDFPRPIARLLGAHKDKPAADYFIWLEILIGTFAGVALLKGI